jgi:hypothetical protein
MLAKLQMRTPLDDLLIIAQETAAEIRTMADYEEAQMIVALQAEIATRPFDHDPMACRLSDYFCAEVWRLARH